MDVDLRAVGVTLAEDVEAVLPAWVVGCVSRLVTAWSGRVEPDVALAAEAAGQRCRAEVGAALRSLVEADVDDQATTPLAVARRAVAYPTAVLAAAGVPPLERDAFRERRFPDDLYDLTPTSWADLHPDLAEPGIVWGAAKAWEHKRRHVT